MENSGGSIVLTVIMGIIGLAFGVLMIASWWKIFAKAGKPGWAAIVPIYNIVVILQICEKPLWWIALLLIPVVNFLAIPILGIILMLTLAQAFNKTTGFAIGLILLSPIFLPMLGFGSAGYRGLAPAAVAA